MPVRYKLDEIDNSMTLGQSLHLPDGRMLLAAGTQLNEKYREKLREFGFNEILVAIPGTEDVHPDSVVKTQKLREMLSTTREAALEIQNTVDSFRKKTKLKMDELIRQKGNTLKKFVLPPNMESLLDQIISDLFKEPHIVLNLEKIDKEESQLFHRMVRVAVVSLCIGKKYNLSKDELRQLGAGALHHDFGLAMLPSHLWNSEQELSPEEEKEYKLHTIYGYTLLSQKQILPPTSRIISLQHHEHQDGNGYPQKLSAMNLPPVKRKGQEKAIHRFAEIVSVADAWDIYSMGRPRYSPPNTTSQALKQIINDAGTKLNRDIVKKLVSMIPVFPVGNKVRIQESSDTSLVGARAVVSKDNPSNLAHPEIIVFEDSKGQRLDRPQKIRTGTFTHTKIQLEI